jgi:Zn finger protein HypA/HybF involved in hydrogenase expression
MSKIDDDSSPNKRCLKCRKMFVSKDVKRNWICPSCNSSNSSARGGKVVGNMGTGRKTKGMSSD